jgi:Holliday junction resolvasome RuvABC endonuclease subunit
MIILSLDVSSTTIGWGVLEIKNNNIKYIDSGYFKPSKKGDIFSKLDGARQYIISLFEKYKPDDIAIEEIVQFMQGKSTAKTIIMLTTYNRCLGLLAYDYLGKPPQMFSVMQIRHGLKINKILPKKEEMPDLVSNHLGITFPWELNKKGAAKVENYDQADGIAVGLYYAHKITGKLKKK